MKNSLMGFVYIVLWILKLSETINILRKMQKEKKKNIFGMEPTILVPGKNVRGKMLEVIICVRGKMSEVIMSEVKMSEVKMSEVIMSDVIMSEVKMLRGNYVRGKNVRGNNVRGKMSEVKMSEVKMSEVIMPEVIMSARGNNVRGRNANNDQLNYYFNLLIVYF